jgi:signal transduction histidine kinase
MSNLIRRITHLAVSFRTKIFLLLSLFIVVISSILTGYILQHDRREHTEQIRIEGELLAGIFAHNTRLPVFSGNSDMLLEAAAGIMQRDEVIAVAVFDADGKLLMEKGRPGKKQFAGPRTITAKDRQRILDLLTTATVPMHLEQASFFEFFAPIASARSYPTAEALYFDDGSTPVKTRPQGLVRVVLDKEPLNAKLQNLTQTTICLGLFFLLVGSATAYLVLKGITSPLETLTAGVNALGTDGVFKKIRVRSHDEIGKVTKAFNDMIDSLERRESARKDAVDQLHALNCELEQRVRERTADLESFTYSTSHDLRAPLLRISGYSKALQEDYADQLDEPGQLYLERMNAVCCQMEQIIKSMMMLSQDTQGEFCREQVDLSALVAEICAGLRELQPELQTRVVIEPGIEVNGNPRLLRLMLENLLDNAWKFAAKEPEPLIEVGIVRIEGRVTYFIRDNGVGFDMKYVDRLFTPFQRLHNAGDYPGSGIGLAVVRKIINRHDGDIWLESAQGKGATCFITL